MCTFPSFFYCYLKAENERPPSFFWIFLPTNDHHYFYLFLWVWPVPSRKVGLGDCLDHLCLELALSVAFYFWYRLSIFFVMSRFYVLSALNLAALQYCVLILLVCKKNLQAFLWWFKKMMSIWPYVHQGLLTLTAYLGFLTKHLSLCVSVKH